jgi:hypothetical protein
LEGWSADLALCALQKEENLKKIRFEGFTVGEVTPREAKDANLNKRITTIV